MDLNARAPAASDLNGCYRVCYAVFGYPEDPGDNVARELRLLWEHPNTLARVVEDRENTPAQIVGYWDAAFVADAFAAWLRDAAPPYVNTHLATALPGGSRSLLGRREVARAQAGEGLTLLVTHWGWDIALPPGDRLRVQERMSREFFAALRGYNVKEVLIEVVGRDLYRLVVSLGYRLRQGHGEDPERQAQAGQDLRPFLVGASRGETGVGEWISPVFVFAPARLCFTARQQALLAWTLERGSDAGFGASQAPALSAGGVKKRWDEVFGRVERAQRAGLVPELLPEPTGGGRGPEKRRHLLEYLREHPEELRPTARSPADDRH